MRKKMTLVLALYLAIVPATRADGEPQTGILDSYEEAKNKLDSGKADNELQARIFDYFIKQAEKGDRNARYVVGTRYEAGLGTTKNLDMAYQWYAKAADQGHELAKAKLEKRGKSVAPKEAVAPVVEAVAPVAVVKHSQERPVKKQKAVVAQTADKEKEMEKVARAQTQPAPTVAVTNPAPPVAAVPAPAVPTPAPIDALGVVMRARWAWNGRAAEILPSDLTSCLTASETETVCFSEKVTRETGDVTVTYLVKSTLSGFARDGGFTVNYLFNVLRIRGAKEEGEASSMEDPTGMMLKLGWQEPGIQLHCKVGDEKTLTCYGSGKNAIRFSRY